MVPLLSFDLSLLNMSYSLQDITWAWANWKARQRGTSIWFVETTNYSNQPRLNDYHQYEMKVALKRTDYGTNDGQLVNAIGTDQWFNNYTSQTLTQHFTYGEEHSSAFTLSLTEGLKVGTTVSAGITIPEIFTAGVSVTTEVNFSSTQDFTTIDKRSWSDTIDIPIAPMTSVHAQTTIKIQKLHVPFTSLCKLTGHVATWFNNQIDFNNDGDYHYLWFPSISYVLQDCINNNIISTQGYGFDGPDVVAKAPGYLTGESGIGVLVNAYEFPLQSRGDVDKGHKHDMPKVVFWRQIEPKAIEHKEEHSGKVVRGEAGKDGPDGIHKDSGKTIWGETGKDERDEKHKVAWGESGHTQEVEENKNPAVVKVIAAAA